MYTILIITLYAPLHYALSPFTSECFQVLYRNFSFHDLFLPFENDTTAPPFKPRPSELSNLPMPFVYGLNFKSPKHQDLIDFNKISEDAENLTRRGLPASFFGYDDPEDVDDYDQHIEPKKKKMLININLQFLIHTRYKVYAALRQREPFRNDKRYKLGYLFNRLRRSKTEMRKVYALAAMQNVTNEWFRSLHSLLRYYEQVVRYDVDIRDTMDLINELYKKKEPYDYYQPKFYHPKTG